MHYLFHGANDLARSEAVAALRALIPAEVQDFNLLTLDGRKLKPAALIAACDAIPFLHDRRMVVVEDAVKHLKAGTARDEIQKYLPNVPPTTDVVWVEHDDFDKRSSVFTLLKKLAQVREFLPLEGAEMTRWLAERAQRQETKIAPDAAALLLEWVGNDGRALANEIAKLAAYVGPKAMINVQAVRLLVADDSESSVFGFVDALAARRLGAALQLVHNLLDEGQAPIYLLFMVGRQVRLLLAVSELLQARMRPDAMAAQLGQKPFVVKKAVDQAARFTPAVLMTLHDRLTQLDHWIKTGRIEPETALELLVAETCAS